MLIKLWGKKQVKAEREAEQTEFHLIQFDDEETEEEFHLIHFDED